MPRFYDRVLVNFAPIPPTSRKDMRWTCASRDGRQDHLRQDFAKLRCYMVSGGGAKETMESCTRYGLHEYGMEYGLPRALLLLLMEIPTQSVGGGMFTFEEMMRVAAYMARVKDGDASEDVVPALKIHGRKYDQ